MNQTKLEMIRLAKELVMNEYTERRAQEHNKWLVESDHLWRTQQLRLAYPIIPAYPTESEIIARAEKLMAYVSSDTPLPENQSTESTPVDPANVTDAVISPEPPRAESVTEKITAEPIQTVDTESEPKTEDSAVQSDELKPLVTVKEAEEKVLDLIADYAKFKAEDKLQDRATTTSRILPSVLKKIDDMRNWRD